MNKKKKQDVKKLVLRIACFALAALMLVSVAYYAVYFLFM